MTLASEPGPDADRSASADPVAVAADLRREGLRLGFSRMGIAAASPPPHHEAFRGWLEAGERPGAAEG